MNKLMKQIPNMLTLLRLVLTVFIDYYIVFNFKSIIIPSIVTIIIFLSDFFDGRIARKYDSTSNVGAIFDVTSDLFYIILSYVIFYSFQILPLWFLFIVIFKFTEFILTSHFIKRLSSKKSMLIFDFLGRIAAVLFYAIPFISYLSFVLLPKGTCTVLVNLFICTTTLLVFASSAYRIFICINRFKVINSEV